MKPICIKCQERPCEKQYKKQEGSFRAQCSRCLDRLKTERKFKINRAALLELQGGVCAICKEIPKVPCIDHCHTSGTARGILCGKCNFLLGFAKDDVAILQAAIEYLLCKKF